jgi:cbb3-type cytochrome oxidase cytochrome c subunit
VPKPNEDTLYKIPFLNLLFAISSIGLLLVIIWMVVDDYSRSWKGYQRRFQALEAAKTEAALKTAEESVSQDELKDLRGQLATEQAAVEARQGDLQSAQNRLAAVTTAAYKDDLTYRTLKSTYDARKFEFEEARHAGSSAPALEKEMRDIGTRMEEYRVKNLEHDQAKAEATAALRALTAREDGTRKKIADLTAGIDRLEKRLEIVAPLGPMKVAIGLLNAPLLDFVAPTRRIQQVVVEKVPLDINFARIPRADRCTTCHLAADRAGFEEDAQPFRTHPKPNLFVGASSPHPIDRFGCTPCHRGRDRAVEFVYATHTPDTAEQRDEWHRTYDWERDHHWDHPMLPKSRVEAGCLKCHQGVVTVPEAPRLNRGLQLIDRYGCYGCHKLTGFNDRPKVAPRLTRITSKTGTDWIGRWIKNPKAFRPSTRMPRFFGLPNNQGPGDAEREDAEITGVVAYLADKAEKFPTPPLPGRGDARRGATLVATVGCMGCHAIERDEAAPDVLAARAKGGDDPVVWERRFGPDLSRIGSKARPEWIFQWIQNPKAYNPDTRMPRLRLSTQEALDITAYLSGLKDDSPAGERAAPSQSQPPARDAALLAFLSQRLPPADAQAKLAALSGHERDVLLGQRTISRYGCFGCHLIPGFEKTPPIGTDLSEEGSKPADLLLFGFVDIEHTAPAWFYQKLKSPRSFDADHDAAFYDRLRMPQFGFTDEQADAVTLVLQGLTKEKVPLESVRRLAPRDDAIEAGRRIVHDYNCQGCHIVDGRGGAIRQAIAKHLMSEGRSEDEASSLAPAFAPPIIEGEGDKVQPDWLFGFLKAPTPIRPWLQVRMPSFDFSDRELNAVVTHFAAKDGRTYPFQTIETAPPTGANLQAAIKMMSPDYFSCWNCHQNGARKPAGPPEGWAPDLTLAHRRLNPDWIGRFIENPQKLMPGAKMPTYYDPADPKGSAPPDILGGDPQRQIEVLRDYIFTLGQKRGGMAGAQP